MQRIIDELHRRLPATELRRGEPMSAHTTFRIGGAVSAMLLPSDTDELVLALAVLREMGVKPLIIGNGSNLLVDDKPLDIIVIKTADMTDLRMTGDTTFRAACGVSFTRAALFARRHRLEGLEFAQGIPGTVGGAVYMNAGAYGGETGAVVTEVSALTPEGAVVSLPCSQCGFGYRHSVFQDNGHIVLSAEFALAPGDPEQISSRALDFMRRRRESQPLDVPSAGSAFKRPENGYAAEIIERCGLKGYRVGGAAVSEKHSGFIVNDKGASFNDVLRLIEHVQSVAAERAGVELTPEIRIIRSGRWIF